MSSFSRHQGFITCQPQSDTNYRVQNIDRVYYSCELQTPFLTVALSNMDIKLLLRDWYFVNILKTSFSVEFLKCLLLDL